ncbi:MAG: hypothetical protein KY443_01145, partial [Actinobacteria bacterium]|nr:hypothetical protein [Actinomycetota bacterium]
MERGIGQSPLAERWACALGIEAVPDDGRVVSTGFGRDVRRVGSIGLDRRVATCFHHSDRETGRACTRCGRPACVDCLHEAPVGAHCWECIRAAR